MRILFTIGSFNRGGKERRMISLMEDLAERGFELGLIASVGSPNRESVRSLVRKFYDYRPGARFFNLREHQRAIHDFRPDIVHSWNRICTTYALLAGMTRCRVLTSEITDARPLSALSGGYWVTRFNFALSNTVLSNSKAGLVAKRAPKGKGRVIYNGYRMARLAGVDERKYAHLAREKGLNVVMAARFCREKDYMTAVKTAALSQAAGLDLSFVFAGDGPDLLRMRAAAADAGLKNVSFPGHVPDMDNLLHHMDVGILATDPRYHEEGIPNSVMECMAHGLPVVVTAGPAMGEIVLHGYDGYIVPSRNPKEIFDKLRMLEADRQLLRALGCNAAKTVREQFDLEAMAEDFVQVYREILGTKMEAVLAS